MSNYTVPAGFFEALTTKYLEIMKNEASDNWVRGDIALQITDAQKKLAEQGKRVNYIKDFLLATGESRSHFNQYRWVSSVFDTQDRGLPGVSWTHYRTVAGTDDPKHWVKEASNNKWNVKKLRDEVCIKNAITKIQTGINCAQCQSVLTNSFCELLVHEIDPTTNNISKARKLLCSKKCVSDWLTNNP